MGYTTRGRSWELRQSWYFLAFFTYYLYWVPILYTGLRVFEPKWIVWGLFYASPFVLTQIASPDSAGVGAFLDRTMFAAFVIAAIHALVARGEFLVRLQTMQDESDALMDTARLRVEAAEPVEGGNAGLTAASALPPPSRKTFDVNTVTEREIAFLPGMGPEIARQAVTLREALGQFRSFDHFADKMGLGGEQRAKLRPFFEDPDAPPPPPLAPSDPAVRKMLDGRLVLELNLAEAESIATLPGVGPAVAAHAIALREADGPFKSIEDFRYRVGLSLDVMVNISPLVSTDRQRKKPADGVKPSGRILDV